MASVHLDQNGKSMDAVPVKHFSRSESKWLRAPRKLPRVGDEFQVELPPLSAELNLVNARYRADYRHNLFIGLPIPVTCSSMKHGTPFKDETYSGEAHKLLVPGVCSERWSDEEKSSFLLGLYFYQNKNFVAVRRFVESKEMETVLSYYYGEFYGSAEYSSWSRWRKGKSKKIAYCRSIFSGLRHQKILSRLLPSLSEDRRDALLEVSKQFGGKKISLLDYVSTLKTMVGINKLVEAVGIDMCKRDLAGRTSAAQFTVVDTRLPGSKKRKSKGLPVETLNLSTVGIDMDERDLIGSTSTVQFTVVDTSLSSGIIRESKGLPVETLNSSTVGIDMGKRDLTGSTSTVQFTVVDTSLSGGIIRESKGLPVETLNLSTRQNSVENSFKNASDEITDESETTKSGPEISDKSIGKLKRKEEFHEKNQMKKVAKSLSGQKMKRACTDFIAPNTKRGRQLTSGNWEETNNCNVNAPGPSCGNETPPSIDLNLPQVSLELEYQITEQIEATGSSHGNESLLLIDLNLPQVCQEVKNQIPWQNDVPASSRGNEYLLLIDLNTPQVSQDFENQIPEPNDVRGSSRGNESPLLFDLNLPQASQELENQMPEKNDAPGSSRGNGSPLLIDLNRPPVSQELAHQIPVQNYVAGPSCGNESRLFIDLNLPQVSPELDYQILEQNDPLLPNSSAMEAGSEQQVTEARLEQQPIVNPQRHSTRSRPPTTRAVEALAHGYLTVKRRRKSKDSSI